VSYAEISARLGIPVGSIGPNRGRCLDKLRRHPAIAALTGTDSETTPEMYDQASRGDQVSKRASLPSAPLPAVLVADQDVRGCGEPAHPH
jgi:hypothetical protein